VTGVRSGREGELAAAYQRARPRLLRLAYATLGSRTEAEDVVSDCWLRLAAADAREPVRDVEGWAVIAVARAALDTLRSARLRRELYVGPWLPEPVVEFAADDPDPADRVSLDDTVSWALLVVLETLTPAERTSWVLHDLFGLPFAEVADVVGRTPAAVRQLAGRARAHVRAAVPRVAVDRDEHRTAVARFLNATRGGDLHELLHALDPAVVLTTDSGGAVTAARRPVVGADRVARFLLGAAGKWPDGRAQLVSVNGVPGLAVIIGDRVDSLIVLTFRDERITRVDIIRAPEKVHAATGGRIRGATETGPERAPHQPRPAPPPRRACRTAHAEPLQPGPRPDSPA